jgi:DNA repair exonuclease SbcCD ATPase subunit
MVVSRAKEVDALYTRLGHILQVRRADLQGLNASYNDAKEDHRSKLRHLEELGEAIEVTKKLMGELSKHGMEHLQALLTYGMSTIFHDRIYRIEIEISEYRNNKTAEFWLIETKNGRDLRARLRSGVGGGVVAIVSLILRIYFCVTLKLRRFLVLDESLSQLSSKYVEGLFKFLHTVKTDLGFKILFVTHDPRFLEYGDRIYSVKDGVVTKEKRA